MWRPAVRASPFLLFHERRSYLRRRIASRLDRRQAIEKGRALFKARKDKLGGFEIWDMARVVV
jgi:hypothetical protein